MKPEEKADFTALFDKLCAGLGAMPTDARRDAYFEGLAKMSLVQFSRVVDFCLSQEGPEKFPNVPAAWKIWRQVRDRSRAQAPRAAQPHLPPEQSWGLQQVNGMFLLYLSKRRMAEQFRGDINLRARRAECLEIAKWLDDYRAEDMTPTREERQAAFDAAMRRIPDLSLDDGWLAHELARQRQEDQERARQ